MPTFKQKNVIKSYKLRLQEKLKTISDETENATHFLNNRLLEFRNRVQHILEIKDEKCLSLYRKLIRDLESYSEKLFILQASFEEVTEDESESSVDEHRSAEFSKHSSKTFLDCPPLDEAPSVVPSIAPSSAEEDVNLIFSCREDDGGSITEDDFCSLHSDNNMQNTNRTPLNYQADGCHIEHITDSKYESNINASQSSCYRSISSNISESTSFHTDNNSLQCVEPYSFESKNKGLLESRATFVIQPTNLEVSSHFSATFSCIIDPGNFWIQIENSHGSNISFPKSECGSLSQLHSIKEGSFCLAPSSSFYYRAKSLSDAKSAKEPVKVIFIDHGSTQDILLCDLRPLPVAAYSIPAQAVHCYLYGILPKNGVWSKEAIERLKGFQNCCIETSVKSKEKSYGVELVAKLAAELDEDFSVDIGQALCLDGLTVSINESPMKNITLNQLPRPEYNKADSSLEVSGSYDINAISSDSGVSVTSAYKSSQISKQKNTIFNKDLEGCSSSLAVMNKFIFPCNTNLIGFNHDTQIKDLISFDSYDALEKFQNTSEDLKLNDRCFTSSCLVCRRKDFCLHLKIPSPSLLFVEKDMVIVMLSHIVNPNEFYVNMAMVNAVTLDELREQMTNMYESPQNWQQVNVEDLSENMFCAGRFADDNYWYRFKILRISPKDLERDQVFGQYIDYGNVATVKFSDLQPLTSQFSQHPIFAIKCSLAGVLPMGNELTLWNENAINVFKKLTSFDRCLTAQICNELADDQMDSYPVLLWDTKDFQDLLINSSLADHKVAVFDYTLLHPSLSSETAVKQYKDIDSWNPMLEEYYDTENSYAVNDEDLEVITTGYHAQDEKYTCKYFSLHGRCPRGANCPYEHHPLLESGVTRDKEEVYCLDSFPVISEDISNVLVQVSALVNPGHFYVVLPYGCKTVDVIDGLVYNGSSYNEIINSEAKKLFYALDKHYSKTPFQENTSIALSCGTIVAAKRKWDEKWHRGRIVDVVGINEPAKVFFVDSGDQEWVSRKFIRTVSPQFLHTPFQAIQCNLYEIEPKGSENGLSWSSVAINYFKDIVAGEVLLAEILHRFGQIFHVSLRKTSQHHHQSVAKLLVSAGYAQYNKVIPSDKKESLYVPG